ncbi:MAG TPA: DUF1254 domain-containing protein [Lacipirellulaceae bacterium]|nr:DUF1254 domain-containing protein [Lacipirellulaceae bacterium]
MPRLRLSSAFVLTAAISFNIHAALAQWPNDSQRQFTKSRAVEAAIWGMPAVNYERLLEAATANGGKANQVIYWSRPVNWRNQTLTPNPDTIYFNPFYDTRNGPIVLEIPPAAGESSIVGSVDDAWQNALDDVGLAGVDKGHGGKYLITPPGYKDKAPEGYIVLPSDTYRGFAILRSNLKSHSDADIAAAVTYGKQIEFYPLSAEPSATAFIDVYDKNFEATIPYDPSFIYLLDKFIQAEPWLTRDKAMIDMLRSIGIERGKGINLDSKMVVTYDVAVNEAHSIVEQNYKQGFTPPFFEGTHWAVPVPKETIEGMSTMFADPNRYPIDGRAVYFSIAYFSAKHLGAGQFYVMAIGDSAGQPLDGSKTYRLTVPPNAPVRQYWSATAYDGQTHALIKNMPRASCASNGSNVKKDADGSVDMYFAPKSPGGNESNWVPTDPNGKFEILFRFYGPEKPLFDKTWKLPDIEQVN